MRNAVLRPLLLLALALALTACGTAAGGSVAASVDGEEVPRDRLERMVRAQLSVQGIEPRELEAEERRDRVAPVQQQMLTALIQFEILDGLADEFDVTVGEDEIDEAFEEQVQQFGGEEAYQEQTGLTEEEFRELIVATQARVDALLATLTEDVSEQELEEAYEAQLDTRYRTRTVRHILLESEEAADDVVADLEEGADFGELAEERSQDPGSAAEGGELGSQPRGQYVQEFDEAVWEAEVGEVAGPVETEFGFHVFEVLSDDVEEFEDVRDDLEQELTGGGAQQAFQSMLQSAFVEADVEVDPAYGSWDATSGSVVEPEAAGEPEPAPEGGGQAPAPEGGGQAPTEEELQEELEQQQDDGAAESPDQ